MAKSKRIDREICRYSWRVELSFEDGMWAAYHGWRKNDRNDDAFTGWISDLDELLTDLCCLLPFRVYKAVERVAYEMEAT